jgi:hypothetical protein
MYDSPLIHWLFGGTSVALSCHATWMSHHRRALEKLRPILSLYYEYGEDSKQEVIE